MLNRNKLECLALIKYFEYVGEEAALRDLPVTDIRITEDGTFLCFTFRRHMNDGIPTVHIMVDPETGATLIRDLP